MDTPINTKRNIIKSGQGSLMIKLIFILFIILLLMIPSSMIESMIWERKGNQENVASEIATQFGRDLTVTAPILAIPRIVTLTDSENKKTTYKSTYFLTAKDNNIDGSLKTEVRHKSIYEVIVYQSNVAINGVFDITNLPESTDIAYELDKAYLILGLNDNAALIDQVKFKWNESSQKMKPGTISTNVIERGIHAASPLQIDQKEYAFDLTMNLRGSKSINVIPTARNNEIALSGDWGHPGFVGNKSPKSYTIEEGTFAANWTVFDFGMAIPESWADGAISFNKYGNEAFGVKLVSVVDHYQKNFRAVKYALMIIILSFMAFFFFEIFNKKKIHPIQYLLIGASLTLFYSLLLSLSEHVGFTIAYGVSSLAIILLIGMYTYFILGSGRSVVILIGCLFGLYTYIFVLLQLESYALLVGSIGLFVILFAIMFLTRKVDWYAINKPELAS